jgi:hypothetical protein
MKTQETKVKVLDKETKTGTTNGRDWEITEYTIVEETEYRDGSVTKIKVRATAAQSLGELEVGAEYNVVLFISSRDYEKDGKKNFWNSFRISKAEKVSDAEPKEEVVVPSEEDNLPF